MAVMTNAFARLLPLAALLLPTASVAQSTPVSPPTAASTATTDADPALWVVKDKDTTIYLFGTIHVLKPGLSWFDEAVKTAFDNSGELRLEMVLPETDDVRAEAMKVMVLPSGQTLTAKLPEPARAKYAATLAQYGMPPAALDRFTPWAAANSLTVLPLMKLGYDLEAGAEKVLTAAAKTDGKTISGFETLSEQLGFFASLTEKAQVDFLVSVVDDLPKTAPMLDTMVGDWGRGDPAALGKLMNEDLDKNRELAEVLLYRRNANWADWIKTRMDQPGTVFVAVGAGHLAGQNSLQELLAKRGLKAERIKY